MSDFYADVDRSRTVSKGIKPLTLDMLPGTHIDKAIEEAQEKSKQLDVVVFFRFNGQLYMVFPTGFYSNNPSIEFLIVDKLHNTV